jgi:HAD superfamily hydrolase (TIGR01509 family)
MELFQAQYLPSLQATPGAHDLIDRLHEDGLQLVIATSAKEKELGALLEQAGLGNLVQRRTTSDDAEESKPDPDIVHAALARGKLAPNETLMLGDTPYDIEAAQRADVRTIALRCGGWWADDALGGAVAIYDNPAELVRKYATSPLRRR